jgi:cytoskeletal protein RodZ
MSETNETNGTNGTNQPQEENASQPVQKNKPEKVGDILHRERVVKRISLETVAKDLKLNIDYIKAIESNSFHLLPAQPYVRVYLRSIATYLMLDPDMILKQYFKDRGITETESSKGESERIKINTENDTDKPSATRYILIFGIIIAAVVVFVIGNRMGWIKTGTAEGPAAVADTTSEIDEEELEAFEAPDSTDSLAQELVDDSIMGLDSLNIKSENGTVVKDTLRFVIKSIRDSVWVQVFYDGKSWKNFVRENHPRVFYAADSINIHVGENAYLHYFLNGKRIRIKGKGVKLFKIDSEGADIWTMSKWKTVFKDRL